MSKCWYCNNELTTGDNPKHFGICNKCYDEMFKSGDTIIRSFTNKITELQKQLEESEEERELLINDFEEETEKLRKQIKQESDARERFVEEVKNLKQQLAEKEKEIKNLVIAHFESEINKPVLTTTQMMNQDKISFAIEQLEKVKEWCENHKFSDEYDYVIAYEPDEEDASGCVDYLKEEIDNQIKQLKEGK